MARYSDFEMSVATQIAYMDFNPLDIVNHPEWTVKDHLEHNPSLANKMKNGDQYAYDAIMNGECGSWKIKDVELNENSGNGFAACLIETGDNKAIVGFRGSEDFRNPDNLVNDWIKGDAGLFNSTETAQQKSAEEYMKYIDEKYGHLYDEYALSGHSLGGNLAEHATIAVPSKIQQKITHTMNLDGPGFSDEYAKKHKKKIEKVAGIIDHKRASLVGHILMPLPGTNVTDIKSSKEDGVIGKHSTKNFAFDQNGKLIVAGPEDYNTVEVFVESFSQSLNMNSSIPGLIGILPAMFNFVKNPHAIKDYIEGLFKWAENVKLQYVSAQSESSFEIHTPELDRFADVMKKAQIKLANYSDEVMNIKRNIQTIIKLSAMYTLGYKLGNISNNIDKIAVKSGNMSRAGKDIVDMYSDCERKIISNAD